jgi:hypothetical protein
MDFGAINAAEVLTGGRAEYRFTAEEVTRTSNRVDSSGVIDLLTRWQKQDNTTAGAGGRPPLIPQRAVLVALLLLASRHHPLWLQSAAEVLRGLDPASKVLLGLPTANIAADQLKEQKRWHNNTHNSFHRMLTGNVRAGVAVERFPTRGTQGHLRGVGKTGLPLRSTVGQGT